MEVRISLWRKTAMLLCALALQLMLCMPMAGAETDFAGGSGTADDPYQIAMAEQRSKENMLQQNKL